MRDSLRYQLSRRRFLAGSFAAIAAAYTGRLADGSEPATDPNKWVLFADTHIWEVTDEPKNGTFPARNLRQAEKQCAELTSKPSGVVVCGDCAALVGNKGDYEVWADCAPVLDEAGIPLHFVMGNHDHREHFYAVFPEHQPDSPLVEGRHITVLETPEADWFLLDSLDVTNYTPGLLGESQRRWLEAALDSRPDKPALVAAHHNPDWNPDTSGLRDTGELFEILTARRRVKAYLFGHTHRWGVGEHEGIHLINVPALGWLFDDKQPRGWVEATTGPDSLELVLHALDGEHPEHQRRLELAYR